VAAALLFAAAAPHARAATLYGLIDTGELFRSTDDGASWTPHATLPVRDATALSARLSTSDLFLASRSGGIYRSEDAGANWAAVGSVPASDVADLLIRPDGSLVVLTATGTVLESADLGATFTPLAALPASNFVSLAGASPATRHFALTRTGETWETEDSGATWTPKGTFPAPDAVRLRAVGGSLYALTGTGSVYRSDDRAATWTPAGTLSQLGMRALARNGATLAAATREGHVATSADGASWTWQGSINQLTLTALASDEPATTGVGGDFPVASLDLGAPFPNPTRGALSFALRLERPGEVALALYDLAGRRVAGQAGVAVAAGARTVAWDPGPLSPGLHLLMVTTDDGRTATRRCVVVR
jgi:hypothetical protein